MSRRTSVAFSAVTLAIVGSCRSEERRVFERVAHEMNPALMSMRSKVARIMGVVNGEASQMLVAYDRCARDQANHEECVTKLCDSHTQQLVELSELDHELFTSSDDELRKLRGVDFASEYLDSPFEARREPYLDEPISFLASHMLDDRWVDCADDTVTVPPLSRCDRIMWCVRNEVTYWRSLVHEVERLRTKANEVGVNIVSISP
jgi:hypothetical protein